MIGWSNAKRLLTCLGKLPDKQRQTFDRCYEGSQSIKTIAQETGQTPNALYMFLRRVRRSLYECVTSSIEAEAQR